MKHKKLFQKICRENNKLPKILSLNQFINGKDLKKEESLNSLFIEDSLFKTLILNEQTIDFGSFRLSDVIILNQLTEISSGLLSELIKFSEKGGAIVIIPNSDIKNSNFNAALSTFNLPVLGQKDTSKLKTEKLESLFFEGVFEKKRPSNEFAISFSALRFN